MNYNWNRYYDPGLGQYVSPDSILKNSGGRYLALVSIDPELLRVYAYGSGNPVQFVDPNGAFSLRFDKYARWLEYAGASFDLWDVMTDTHDTLLSDVLSIGAGTALTAGCTQAAAATFFMTAGASLAVGASCVLLGIGLENLTEFAILELSGPPILDRDDFGPLWNLDDGGDFCPASRR